MKTDEPEENAAPEPVTAFRLAPSQLLPAICPTCGAPGTRPQALKVSGTGPLSAGLDAHFCDICADHRLRQTTRHLAWLGSSTLLVLAGTTATALALGTRDLALQLAVPILVGALLPVVLGRLHWWNVRTEPLDITEDARGLLLFTQSKTLRRALILHGLVEVAGHEPPHIPPLQRFRTPLGLACLGLAWLLVLHSLGGAEVRVLLSGHEKAVLLVDTRHFGKIAPTNAEDPRAGESVRVLGGRRRLELISESGALLGGATKTIWPGRTYIVGQLPPGQCLYWERREYGKGAGGSSIFPLGGSGPVWELRDQVDSWFVPLEGPPAEQEAGAEGWETRGGQRRAIRLLPCRANGP